MRSTGSARRWAPTAFLLAVAVVTAACGIIDDDPVESEGGADDEAIVASGAPAFPAITSDFPLNSPKDLPSATFAEAAQFAWLEFIALNWPAQDGTRDQPDTGRTFGDVNGGPLVWETFRSKVETFPRIANGTPAGAPGPPLDAAAGYTGNIHQNAPNEKFFPNDYQYLGKTIAPCNGKPSTSTPWVNLDETSQIGLNDMYAGTVEGDQLIRFAVKANQTQYVYLDDSDLFDQAKLQTREDTFSKDLFDQTTGAPLAAPTVPVAETVVRFPAGTIEIKAGWRQLNAKELTNGKFHTETVRYYKEDAQKEACYVDDIWGLVSLHIMSRVPSTPDYFTFATFEYAENILLPDGTPVEDANGQVINAPAGSAATTPALSYKDDVKQPTVTASAGPCTDPGKRLFYINTKFITEDATDPSKSNPPGGQICIDRRSEPIPDTVIEANTAAHVAIREYVGKASVWDNYKLVNIQWRPFDFADVDANLENNDNSSTFYLSNIVVETNYTLQNFSGFLNGGTITSNDASAAQFPQIPPNMYTFPNDDAVTGYNMGGCMGCHGNAQLQNGTDFSFILAQKIPASAPDTTGALTPAEVEAMVQGLLATDTAD